MLRSGKYCYRFCPCLITLSRLPVSAAGRAVVDSDYMYGVCFVGFGSWRYRLGFVLMPAAAAMLVGGFFLVRSAYRADPAGRDAGPAGSR